MKMAKKMSAIVLAAVMSVTLLAGCGSKGTDTAAPADSSAAQTTENQGSTDAGTAGEEGLIPITFSRAQDSLMETDIFARMEGASYEDNLWTDLIAERLGYDVKYLWIASSADLQTQKFNAAMAAGDDSGYCVCEQDGSEAACGSRTGSGSETLFRRICQ